MEKIKKVEETNKKLPKEKRLKPKIEGEGELFTALKE